MWLLAERKKDVIKVMNTLPALEKELEEDMNEGHIDREDLKQLEQELAKEVKEGVQDIKETLSSKEVQPTDGTHWKASSGNRLQICQDR